MRDPGYASTSTSPEAQELTGILIRPAFSQEGEPHSWRRARPDETPPNFSSSGTQTGRVSSSSSNLSSAPRDFRAPPHGGIKILGGLPGLFKYHMDRSGALVTGRQVGKSHYLDSLTRSKKSVPWKCNRCGCLFFWTEEEPPAGPAAGVVLVQARFSSLIMDSRDDSIPRCDLEFVRDVMES